MMYDYTEYNNGLNNCFKLCHCQFVWISIYQLDAKECGAYILSIREICYM